MRFDRAVVLAASLPTVRPPARATVLRTDHHRALVATVAGVAGVVVPPYLTAFVMELPGRVEPVLLVPVALVACFAVAAWSRVRRSSLELRSDGVLHRRVLPPDRFIPTADLASVVVLRVIEPRGLRAPRHLFVLDAVKRTRFRMREGVWGAEQLDQVRSKLGVPAQVVDEPLTLADLRQQRVVSLPWWERYPLRSGAALAVSMVAGAAALLLPLTAWTR